MIGIALQRDFSDRLLVCDLEGQEPPLPFTRLADFLFPIQTCFNQFDQLLRGNAWNIVVIYHDRRYIITGGHTVEFHNAQLVGMRSP
jgi:hypothetical protein